MRMLFFVWFILVSTDSIAQDAFPEKPLPPQEILSFPWTDNEHVELSQSYVDGETRYRVGETSEGFKYQIFKNGDAGLTAFGEDWSIHCAPDAMTDEFNCYIKNLTHFTIFIDFQNADTPQLVCVIGHDFPGRNAALRVDSNPALETNSDGCISANSVPKLTQGSSIRTRFVRWPYDNAVDREGTLSGLEQAFNLVRHLRAHFQAMNF